MISRMSAITQLRQARFYLQLDWMFKLSPYWKEQRKSLEILHGFTNQVSYNEVLICSVYNKTCKCFEQVIRERKVEHQQNKNIIADHGIAQDSTDDVYISSMYRIRKLKICGVNNIIW